MDKQRLLEILYDWNPWWRSEVAKDIPPFHRDLFSQIIANIGTNKIEVIVGPRQTGKSTLLKQIIADFIKNNQIPSNRLFYLQLDDISDFLEKGDVTIREILNLFSEEVAKSPLSETHKYVFFDEVHLFKGWAKALKALYDQGMPVKFFVSGSAGSSIMDQASQFLAGRMNVHHLLPMSFSEVVKTYSDHINTDLLLSISQKFKDEMIGFIRSDESSSLVKLIHESSMKITPFASILRSIQSKYIEQGGYPETVIKKMGSVETYSLLKSFLSLMIQKDFVDFFHVRDTRTLERLIKTIAQHTGQILVERNLSSDIGVAINTLRNHLGFLVDTRIISTARALTSSYSRSSRLPEKFYFVDPGLRNSLVGFLPESLGQLTETVVFNHLKQFLEKNLTGSDLTYWRRNDVEVDMIVNLGKHLLPIEVHKGKDSKALGMGSFFDEFSVGAGMLISGKECQNPKVISCPLHLFLLLI